MDEKRLLEKLKRIEALFAGATTAGEREAAASALERIRERLRRLEASDPPVEYRFTLADMWSRRLFVALARRYGLRPYRYPRQRHTTVMVRVPRSFVEQTLWPEYVELNKTLQAYLHELTERVISEGIFRDASEAVVEPEPKQVGGTVGDVEKEEETGG